jgi:hypothetical protein
MGRKKKNKSEWKNEIADELARCGSALRFIGPESALGVSRQDLRNKVNRWLGNQHWVWWRNLGNTQRQAQELIPGPCLGTKFRFLSFNRMQFRVDSLLHKKCGAEDETSVHILCQCEALASLRHAHLGSFFLEPQHIKNVNLEAIWNFSKVTGLPYIVTGAQRVCQ